LLERVLVRGMPAPPYHCPLLSSCECHCLFTSKPSYSSDRPCLPSRLEAWKVPSRGLRLRRGFVGACTRWQTRRHERTFWRFCSLTRFHAWSLKLTGAGLHIETRYFLRSDAIEGELSPSVSVHRKSSNEQVCDHQAVGAEFLGFVQRFFAVQAMTFCIELGTQPTLMFVCIHVLHL